MLWEARAEIWWKKVKAPGKLIIKGLIANPGEILPRKNISCKMVGRQREAVDGV